MWKTLQQGENVCHGDKLRYTGFYSQFRSHKNVFEVVKTDRHYFEVAPLSEENMLANALARRVVKYFDIGNGLTLEVWSDD